ncbi:hypothetical protein [Lysobacter antibioticus]|uniref:Uncharacterized protein n=1 Tax=Lysobacter antibioticus TaxID=84531 RepID=A0A0S2F7F0_LYSAN|nr:hypothetical protein [Lysobacter antibioticus]ALN79466.1 hypothetical protein LA76x_1309 [Lysobacter antibioticus]
MSNYSTNPVNSVGASATPQAQPASQTMSRILELREDQAATNRLLSELESRLDSILGSHPPTNAAKEAAGRLAPSALCGELDDRIGSQRDINSHIGSILERLTV